ncbi:hypothetical protein GALMADRAFT_719684 [Galerina marginata CBS 339.88]|uniref:Uncharacterized protein n=1 Tax=Galerina marginata (strain CBS 339.88) TaxID=685588 RepID=A0A067TN34_GALM3|nr:hypothetical protein GALMADRAFT_719684 [Galerina marginata CBS 339.88]
MRRIYSPSSAEVLLQGHFGWFKHNFDISRRLSTIHGIWNLEGRRPSPELDVVFSVYASTLTASPPTSVSFRLIAATAQFPSLRFTFFKAFLPLIPTPQAAAATSVASLDPNFPFIRISVRSFRSSSSVRILIDNHSHFRLHLLLSALRFPSRRD